MSRPFVVDAKHPNRVLMPQTLVVGNRAAFKNFVLALFRAGNPLILLDFKDTGYIDSSGLGAMVSVTRDIRREGGNLFIGNLNEDLDALFEQQKLYGLFHPDGVPEDIQRIFAAAAKAAAARLGGAGGYARYDVFMCYNRSDQRAVERVASKLLQHGLLPWLDKWELRPGVPWQPALETQLATIKSAAVFVGRSGIGPWQRQEIDVLIHQFRERGSPVIPVLLRSAPVKPDLPPFLAAMQWVDFRKRTPDPFSQLLWGISAPTTANG